MSGKLITIQYEQNTEKRLELQIKLHRIVKKVHKIICFTLYQNFDSTLPLPPAHEHSDIYLQLCT